MINELISNKWFWIFVGLTIATIYKIFFSKDKTLQRLENEYSEIISSNKYKVKGRYE